jgi:hypothetical protein
MRLNKTDWPSAKEWWEALRWVLIIFTMVVVLTMAGSFVSYQQVVQDGHPWMPAIHCPGCFLCGMTRSFCAMSAGQWSEALNWNHGGPFLYIAGWVWLTLTLGFLVTKARDYFRGHLADRKPACK